MRTIPPSAAESLSLAEKHMAAGQWPAAEAVLRQATAAFPELDPAWHSLGLIAFLQGQLPPAAGFIAKAISLNPSAGLYHRNLGEICRRMGRLEEAVLAGRRATELLPRDADAHYNLGLACCERGDWTAAIASCRNALALRPDHGPSWNNLGVALDRSGQRADAEVALSKAVQLNPKHAEAQLNLGAVYRAQGRLEEARRCFEVVGEIAPDLPAKLGVSVNTTVAPIKPPDVMVRDTGSVRGRGVFAGRNFAAGELIETSAVTLVQTPFESLPPEVRTVVFNWGALCGVGTTHALATGYGALFNHNNPANMRFEADPENLALKFIAVRNIAAGEELTVNYNAARGGETCSDDNWFERMNIKPITS